jgi:recombinase
LKETLGKKKLKKKNQEDLEEIKMIYGYVRVSSKAQNEERQIAALKNEGVTIENIFIDKESGKDFNRSAWQKLMAKLVIGDIIVIKELDRMGRNNNEIKENFELIKNKGCYLKFLENPLLSTKGKSQVEIELIQPLVLHLFGYLAEKEREKLLIRQREAYEQLETDEKGRKISKKKNKVVGRPNKLENLTTEQKRYIRAWIEGSIKISDCIKNVGIKKTSLYKYQEEKMEIMKYSEYLKEFKCKYEEKELKIEYSNNNYVLKNGYSQYWFYFYIEENPNKEKEFKIDIVGENGENFLSIISILPSQNIYFVRIQISKSKIGEYIKSIELLDDKKNILGIITSANVDFTDGLKGTLYFSKEFIYRKILFRKSNSEIIEYNKLEEVFFENKKDRDFGIRDFYLKYLEGFMKKE